MNSITHDQADKCSECGKLLVATSSDKWRASSGELIAVPKFDIAYIFAQTSKGEICMCEECYTAKNFGSFNSADLSEIYYQFGLEYQELGRFSESVDALHKGLQLMRSADMLAAIAYSYGETGDCKLASEFYRQALSVDPTHFSAQENLKNCMSDT
jgi:tetratricopeptide (TPR) repeat protein